MIASLRDTRILLTALFALSVLLYVLSAGGCDFGGGEAVKETSEPSFVRGRAELRRGNNAEAMGAFMKVIDKRKDAPESHFELGRLYLDHMNDPIQAIYHFRKYLELKPNSQVSPIVMQMIETAQKKFAASLPQTPYDSNIKYLELQEIVENLRRQNLELKKKLAASAETIDALKATQTVRVQSARSAESAQSRPGHSGANQPAGARTGAHGCRGVERGGEVPTRHPGSVGARPALTGRPTLLPRGLSPLLERADGGDEREDAHAAAHEGDLLLRILHIKAVAEGQQDGELFPHLVVPCERARPVALQAIAHRDALPFRLADGDGAAQRIPAHADHDELSGAHGDLVVRREGERIHLVRNALVFENGRRYFAHISPSTDARSAFMSRHAARAAS